MAAVGGRVEEAAELSLEVGQLGAEQVRDRARHREDLGDHILHRSDERLPADHADATRRFEAGPLQYTPLVTRGSVPDDALAGALLGAEIPRARTCRSRRRAAAGREATPAQTPPDLRRPRRRGRTPRPEPASRTRCSRLVPGPSSGTTARTSVYWNAPRSAGRSSACACTQDALSIRRAVVARGFGEHLAVRIDTDNLGEQVSERQCDDARATADVDQPRARRDRCRSAKRIVHAVRVRDATAPKY